MTDKPTNISLPKLMLLGGGHGKWAAPYDGERWGVNATCLGLPVHMSFHLHDLEHEEKYTITGTGGKKQAEFAPFLSYIKFTNHPVLSIREYPDFPSIKRYPYEEICDYFHTNFFSNSSCYMIAYALWKGYQQIECYGYNFLMSGEYDYELPGLHFWLGIAHDRLGLGKGFRIIGDASRVLCNKDGNSGLRNVSYSFHEPLNYRPEPVPISIKPYYGKPKLQEAI
jgi:hypothetical protein